MTNVTIFAQSAQTLVGDIIETNAAFTSIKRRRHGSSKRDILSFPADRVLMVAEGTLGDMNGELVVTDRLAVYSMVGEITENDGGGVTVTDEDGNEYIIPVGADFEASIPDDEEDAAPAKKGSGKKAEAPAKKSGKAAKVVEEEEEEAEEEAEVEALDPKTAKKLLKPLDEDQLRAVAIELEVLTARKAKPLEKGDLVDAILGYEGAAEDLDTAIENATAEEEEEEEAAPAKKSGKAGKPTKAASGEDW